MTGSWESEDGPGKQAEAPSQVQGMVGIKTQGVEDLELKTGRHGDETGRDARQTR